MTGEPAPVVMRLVTRKSWIVSERRRSNEGSGSTERKMVVTKSEKKSWMGGSEWR
jgi:hypothetical protein